VSATSNSRRRPDGQQRGTWRVIRIVSGQIVNIRTAVVYCSVQESEPMSKRGHNEGSIHLRDDGRWVAVVDLGYHEGKRKRKYLYGRTRREVAEKLKIALREQQ
jgi:hypothetical protein